MLPSWCSCKNLRIKHLHPPINYWTLLHLRETVGLTWTLGHNAKVQEIQLLGNPKFWPKGGIQQERFRDKSSSWPFFYCLPSRERENISHPRKVGNIIFLKVLSNGGIHPGKLTWNLQITHLERKMIFQTSKIMFHVNLQGCMWYFPGGATSVLSQASNWSDLLHEFISLLRQVWRHVHIHIFKHHVWRLLGIHPYLRANGKYHNRNQPGKNKPKQQIPKLRYVFWPVWWGAWDFQITSRKVGFSGFQEVFPPFPQTSCFNKETQLDHLDPFSVLLSNMDCHVKQLTQSTWHRSKKSKTHDLSPTWTICHVSGTWDPQFTFTLEARKIRGALLSIESWLFTKDPYNGLIIIIIPIKLGSVRESRPGIPHCIDGRPRRKASDENRIGTFFFGISPNVSHCFTKWCDDDSVSHSKMQMSTGALSVSSLKWN